MLQMVHKGNWAEFIDLAERYVSHLRVLLSDTALDMKDNDILQIVESLIRNEQEMSQSLKERLEYLQNSILTLKKGKKCNQAYVKSFTSPFHQA